MCGGVSKIAAAWTEISNSFVARLVLKYQKKISSKQKNLITATEIEEKFHLKAQNLWARDGNNSTF